ncbi:MAG: hypothetical protein IKP74_07195 [Clostridia bacterium]|nr:hypothetical protein [Clostridia bacterium]
MTANYSFAIEKGTASPTILAAIADESATVPSVDSVAQSPAVVNLSGENTSYSPASVIPETDSRYLSLARDPQKNESELRRLVKEAAEKAGYNSPLLYHGTGAFGFTIFDLSKMNDRRTIFLTESEEIASTYSGSKGIRGVSGKANILDNVDAVYIATELNNNLPAQEQDNGYYYTAYSRKALSNLEKQNRSDLAKLKLFLKEKGGNRRRPMLRTSGAGESAPLGRYPSPRCG